MSLSTLGSAEERRMGDRGTGADIMDQLHAHLRELEHVSANDDKFLEAATYGLLAVLWGQRGVEDAIKDARGGDPYRLEDADTNTLNTFHIEQETIAHEVWARIAGLVNTHGSAQVAQALIDEKDCSPIAREVIRSWNEAEHVYGPNPDGYTLVRKGMGPEGVVEISSNPVQP